MRYSNEAKIAKDFIDNGYLGDIYYALYLNCEVPSKFESFKSKSTVELKEEFGELAKFFNSIKNDWEMYK